VCGDEGPVMQFVQQARSTARWGHVSIDTPCPCHALSPLSLSVVGPGGPLREGAAIYIGKEGDLAAKEEVSN
jgi:hypothetical protein